MLTNRKDLTSKNTGLKFNLDSIWKKRFKNESWGQLRFIQISKLKRKGESAFDKKLGSTAIKCSLIIRRGGQNQIKFLIKTQNEIRRIQRKKVDGEIFHSFHSFHSFASVCCRWFEIETITQNENTSIFVRKLKLALKAFQE